MSGAHALRIYRIRRAHARLQSSRRAGGQGGVQRIQPRAYVLEKWDLVENLRIAAEDELDEAERIYPEFAATAREEGFPEIAKLYEDIIGVETCHHKLFKQLYEQMKKGTMYKKKEKVKWKCADCGYEATSKEAWKECPLCKAKQGSVMLIIED